MLSKVFVIVLRIIGIVLVFIAPIIHLVIKFNDTETHIIEVTENSMPTVILLLISLIAVVFVIWITSSARMMYLEELKKHPFGTISVLTIGVVLLSIAILLNMWLNKLSDLINFNAEQFALNIKLYSENVIIVIIYVGGGLLCTLASFIWRKAIE